MRLLFILILLGLFFSVSVYSQGNCTEEQIQKVKEFSKNTASEALKLSIEQGDIGDCVHYQWMDKMKNVGVKTAMAVVSFSWQDDFKKFKVKEITFSENYDFFRTNNSKLMESIEKSGLKEDLKEAFISRANTVLSNIIPNARKGLKKKDSDVIKGEIYLHLFDDEILPLQVTTSDTQIY